MIDSVVFFNNFHNGDIFFSKPYVKHMAELFNVKDYTYAHNNNPIIVRDLNMNFQLLQDIDIFYKDKIKIIGSTLYVNTWIGNYLNENRNCNWISLHEMYVELYQSISDILDKKFNLLSRDNYKQFIDFDQYNIPIDFDCDYENTIIFSNGPVNSGQSYLRSTDNIVRSLCNTFPEKKIILTHPSEVNDNKIIYTSNIINANGSDLNEISWLSTKCKYIIGRQSGPFSFMQTDLNVNDSTKTMISFSDCAEVDWLYQINVKSNYNHLIDNDEQKLIKDINDIIGAAK